MEVTLTWKNPGIVARAALVVGPCLVDPAPATNSGGIGKGRDVFLFTAAVARLRVIQKPGTADLKVWNWF